MVAKQCTVYLTFIYTQNDIYFRNWRVCANRCDLILFLVDFAEHPNIPFLFQIIFVLSRHFVNSEWCNYELYFAQQRVMGKTFSDVILVVKEAIDPKSLPSKYCKLKKMLSSKTYLDWPEQPKHQAFFWAQLKSVLGKPSPAIEVQSSRRRRSTRTSTVSVIEVPHQHQEPADAELEPRREEGTDF